MFTTEEKHFLNGCGLPLPFVSLASTHYSHILPTTELEWNEALRQLRIRRLRGVVDTEEASQWYTTVRASLESTKAKRDEVWDLISN